jgi:hypothetical protein
MEKALWRWFVAAASVCAVLTIIACSMAIYAFAHTPNVNEIIVPSSRGGEVAISKATILFSPMVFQTVAFLMTLCPFTRRRFVAEKINETGSKFVTGARVWCMGLCTVSAVNLYLLAQRVAILLWPQPRRGPGDNEF